MDVNDLETNLKDYRKSWNEAGHPGAAGDISVRVPMYLAPTEDDAVEEPRESLEAFFARMRARYEQGRDDEGTGAIGPERAAALRARAERLASLSYEEILDTKVICGTPEGVVDRLSQYQETLGITGFTAELNPGGLLPPEAVKRSLRLLTQEVMPAFR